MNNTYSMFTFNKVGVSKSGGVLYYELNSFIDTEPQHKIKISVDRGYSKAKKPPMYWLHKRLNKKWNNKASTGLFETQYPNVFFGDANFKQDLVVFVFSKRMNELDVYHYRNFYPKNINSFLKTVNYV